MKHPLYKGKRRIPHNIERANLIKEISTITANLVMDMIEDERDECLCVDCMEEIENELIIASKN